MMGCMMRIAWMVLWCVIAGCARGGYAADRVEPADRIGVTHAAGRYHLTDGEFLDEGAQVVRDIGSRVIKVYLTLDTEGPSWKVYAFNTVWGEPRSLVELASSGPFERLFDGPFTTYILTTFGPGRAANYWRWSFEDEDFEREKRQFSELTSHLLRRYAGTGKTFVLSHWEGDWSARGFKERAAVDEARERDGGESNVRVLHAAEVNQVRLALLEDLPTVANRVLPKVRVDLVSYSAYDTQEDPQMLRRALDYIADHMVGGGKGKVYLGEFGLPETRVGPERVRKVLPEVIQTAMDWGCPYVVLWQTYCNEQKAGTTGESNGEYAGYWLIRRDGSRSAAYDVIKQAIQASPASPTEPRK
jgi:hypothetical protein